MEHTNSQYCCRECKREYLRQWRAQNPKANPDYSHKHRQKKKNVIDQYKLERGCTDCGYSELPYVLSFDHVRGEKLFTIGASTARYPLEKTMEEIAKCEVVCHNCHAIRTHDRNQHRRRSDRI